MSDTGLDLVRPILFVIANEPQRLSRAPIKTLKIPTLDNLAISVTHPQIEAIIMGTFPVFFGASRRCSNAAVAKSLPASITDGLRRYNLGQNSPKRTDRQRAIARYQHYNSTKYNKLIFTCCN